MTKAVVGDGYVENRARHVRASVRVNVKACNASMIHFSQTDSLDWERFNNDKIRARYIVPLLTQFTTQTPVLAPSRTAEGSS